MFDLIGKEDDEDCRDMSALVVDQRVGVVFQVIQASGYRRMIYCFQAMDTNNDGLVSCEEFLVYFRRTNMYQAQHRS